MKFYLASRSPRRIEILSQMGMPFSTIDFSDENYEAPDSEVCEYPDQYVCNKATIKIEYIDVSELNSPSIIIAADTIVWMNNRIYSKPRDKNSSKEMLLSLSGGIHHVYSGIALKELPNERIVYGFEKAEVKFKNIAEEDIEDYIDTGEPFDKAGGYGIQGFGSVFIQNIIGNYSNIMGLPICLLTQMFDEYWGVKVCRYWSKSRKTT
jgi:septum formation protein